MGLQPVPAGRYQSWEQLASALLPVRRNVFDLESLPLRVSFETDATGQGHAFRCTGPHLAGGGAVPGIFERVA